MHILQKNRYVSTFPQPIYHGWKITLVLLFNLFLLLFQLQLVHELSTNTEQFEKWPIGTTTFNINNKYLFSV